jgi:ASC-1-like (ASCH) protein
MEHEMRLHMQPFYEIKSGRENYEIRLNDEKRKKVKVGDIIIFRKRPEYDEFVKTKVLEINKYKTFSTLLDGIRKNSVSLDYFSKEDIEKYGFVVFRIKVIK